MNKTTFMSNLVQYTGPSWLVSISKCCHHCQHYYVFKDMLYYILYSYNTVFIQNIISCTVAKFIKGNIQKNCFPNQTNVWWIIQVRTKCSLKLYEPIFLLNIQLLNHKQWFMLLQILLNTPVIHREEINSISYSSITLEREHTACWKIRNENLLSGKTVGMPVLIKRDISL
jgi:hypothetical protein